MTDNKPDKNKVVVITGGTAGIGKATALQFARHGYNVAVLARGQDRLNKTEEELKKIGVKALGVYADVSKFNDISNACDVIESTLGSIDIWINNAMVTIFSEFKDLTPDEFKRQTDVTYLGTVYGTMCALYRMWPKNDGTIVQVGSALSYRAIPLQSAYCGSKYAIRGFTDSLRIELLHNKKDIHLTMVQLPAHNTPQFSWGRVHINKHPQPVPPIFEPEVAAEAIYWAAHNRRREVWVGSPSVAAILGNKVFPGLLDKYLAKNGYSSQWCDKKIRLDRPDNLFNPVLGTRYSVRGIFSKKSESKSTQFIFEKLPLVHHFANPVFALIRLIKMLLKI